MSTRDIKKRHEESYKGEYRMPAPARMARDIHFLLGVVAQQKEQLRTARIALGVESCSS